MNFKLQKILTLAVAIIATAGCTHGRQAPQINDLVVESFSQPDPQNTDPQNILPVMWWQHLNDPALNQLIDQALADNPSLATTWDRLNQAQAIAKRAGAAQALQANLTAQTSADRRRSSGQTSSGENWSLGLFLSYDADLWGRLDSEQEAATLDALATQADLQDAALDLSASVALTWYRLVESRQQQQLIQTQLQTNDQILELIELRFKQGLSSLVDVLRQRQLIQSNQGRLEQAHSRTQVLEHQLTTLLGQPATQSTSPSTQQLITLPQTPHLGLPSELLQRRPDLQRAWYQVQAADQRLAVAIADRYPRLTLSADLRTSNDQLADFLDNWLASIAADLIQPLIDGGRRKAEIQRNQALVSQSINTYRDAWLTALRQVEDALIQETQQQRFIKSLSQQLETSQLVLERSRDRYINGSLDYLDVLNALTTQQSLEREHLDALRQRIEYRINLCRALAGPLPLDPPQPQTINTSTP